MSKNMMKRMICGVLAMTSMAVCVATATACETNTPNVELTLSFNGEEYVLNYELDRRVAPRTVKHFLTLAENGYYDGLCVHNYESSGNKLYTGGYTYENESLVAKEYFEIVNGYENFPVSVWQDEAKANPLYTLTGEFEKNHFNVEKGKFLQTFGSLTMYYNSINSDKEVYVDRLDPEKDGVRELDYKYNATTSLFYISLSRNSTTLEEYCTFAKLEESSEDTLKEFVDDLEEYIDEHYNSDDEDNTFTEATAVTVNAGDPMLENKTTVTYYVPQQPIVIKNVKVKSY